MWDYDAEMNELRSRKKDDSYHFSYDFEYIEKNYGDSNYDIAVTTMEVDVIWSNEQAGYEISFHCDTADDINPDEGNGSIEEFYETDIEEQILSDLEELGIDSTLLVGGLGR